MGMVFLADDPALKRSVALKVMLPEVAARPVARERFLREARSAAALAHDHIVPIFHVAEDRGVPFIAMPLLTGMTLDEYLRRKGRLTVPQALRVGRETAKGLAAAHAKGLVHRDVKPANLWLDATAGGRVKILDFGLARAAPSDEQLTHEGAVLGTPAFMSPEQAAGQPVGPASDLFSLGAVLYLLCTGRRPFPGDNAYAILIALAKETPTPVAALNPDVPPPLADLVMRLLEKDPARRPASAREVAEAIYAVERKRLIEKLKREAGGGPTTVGGSHAVNPNPEESADARLEFDPPGAPERNPRSRRLAALGLSCVLVLVAVLVAVFLVRQPEPGTPTELPTRSSSTHPPSVSPQDDTLPQNALAAGTVWKGLRTNRTAGLTNEFELRVTSRSGKDFVGYTTMTTKNGDRHGHDVKGTIEGGKVEWKVVGRREGKWESQPHKGDLRADKLMLTFEGPGFYGGWTAGTAELSLVKE
jgi:serine/threonine protein kinase